MYGTNNHKNGKPKSKCLDYKSFSGNLEFKEENIDNNNSNLKIVDMHIEDKINDINIKELCNIKCWENYEKSCIDIVNQCNFGKVIKLAEAAISKVRDILVHEQGLFDAIVSAGILTGKIIVFTTDNKKPEETITPLLILHRDNIDKKKWYIQEYCDGYCSNIHHYSNFVDSDEMNKLFNEQLPWLKKFNKRYIYHNGDKKHIAVSPSSLVEEQEINDSLLDQFYLNRKENILWLLSNSLIICPPSSQHINPNKSVVKFNYSKKKLT